MWLVYIFEARGIQPYILAGGRLRHVAGGSAIVHDLCAEKGGNGALDLVIAASGFASHPHFLRRAGGAFAFAVPAGTENASALQKFEQLWVFAVQRMAPGMPFVDASAEDENVRDAMKKARSVMAGRRGFAAHTLPAATPPVLRAARTGNAAVAEGLDGDLLDLGLRIKEDRVAADRRCGVTSHLLKLFVENSEPGDWPVDMEKDFPFLGEDRTIAMFHADGNRMGELVTALGSHLTDKADVDYCSAFLDFSRTVDEVTSEAVKAASDCILTAKSEKDGKFPARPIVCAGDDLTVILRADIALPFAKTFLSTFEKKAEDLLLPKLNELSPQKDGVVWPRLTACGGLIYCHANQPFLSVSELAESACKHAKSKAKDIAKEVWQTVPSCLTIHRITGSLFESYTDIISGELTTTAPERLLTANPYAIKAGTGLATLDNLEALVSAMSTDGAIGGGVFREVATLLYVSDEEGRSKLHRVRERAIKNPSVKKAWESFEKAYQNLASDLPGYRPGKEIELFVGKVSPYNDAISLKQINQRAPLSTGASQ